MSKRIEVSELNCQKLNKAFPEANTTKKALDSYLSLLDKLVEFRDGKKEFERIMKRLRTLHDIRQKAVKTNLECNNEIKDIILENGKHTVTYQR